MDVTKLSAINPLTGAVNIASGTHTSENGPLEFYKCIVDSLPDNIVVIDHHGAIQFTNQSWDVFATKNGVSHDIEWGEYNYFNVCNGAKEDEFSKKAAKGIKRVINKECQSFYLEYPCHSPRKCRWFMMKVSALHFGSTNYYIITHHDITKRKLAEEKVLNLSRIDPLTNISNRRAFDEFLLFQWKHCKRTKTPLTMATIDIDFFKMLNDNYGHQYGDECLKKIGAALTQSSKRPDDICARLGGEEFAILFGNTTAEQSLHVINTLFEKIDALQIPNEKSPVSPIVTVSVGIASIIPNEHYSIKELIYEADQQLYAAKKSGRNQISVQANPSVKH